MTIKEIMNDGRSAIGRQVEIKGWIRNHRKQKTHGFIDFSDGTCFSSIQVVYHEELEEFETISSVLTGSAIQVNGILVWNEKRDQIEIEGQKILIIGSAPENYPLQPKRHTKEFLREIMYLRSRTRVFQAVFRIRSVATMVIHEYFQSRDYLCLSSPILTTNDAEGAGNTFSVTAGEGDFFGKPVSLAVTGQFEAEAFAMAFQKVYTFGPIFRAEDSNTKIHAAEFWMIEPEIAFCNLQQLMDIEEDFLVTIAAEIAQRVPEEIKFLEEYTGVKLKERIEKLTQSKIVRITHQQAITILKEATVEFEFKPEYGQDLAREHEKYLTDQKFKSPVFVYDWPKDIKAFYMYQNDDGETVGGVDLLVPDGGELMGGSQREHRYEHLCKRMEEMNIPKGGLDWYLNLRKFGGCEHAGFGMGFDRFLIYITGMDNIRDVIPFPRTPGYCEF